MNSVARSRTQVNISSSNYCWNASPTFLTGVVKEGWVLQGNKSKWKSRSQAVEVKGVSLWLQANSNLLLAVKFKPLLLDLGNWIRFWGYAGGWKRKLKTVFFTGSYPAQFRLCRVLFSCLFSFICQSHCGGNCENCVLYTCHKSH